MQAFGIADIYVFAIAAIAVVLMPGPNSLYVLSLSIEGKKKKAFQGVAGIVCGDGTLMLIASSGGAAILTQFSGLLTFVQMLGGAYMLWIGLQMLISSWQHLIGRKVYVCQQKKSLPKRRNPFVVAYYISILNPKAIIFFFSFFITSTVADYPNKLVTSIAQILIVQVCSVSYLLSVITIGSFVAMRITGRNQLQGAFQLLIGLGFLFAAAFLALA